jgi:hypothetical protein
MIQKDDDDDDDLVKAIKKVCDRADGLDVFLFVVFLVIFPPLPIIWFAVRVIQEL